MIASAPPLLFRFRETVATMPSVLALIALVLLGVQQTVKLVRHTDESPVQISLMAPEPPPPVPEIPKPVQPPEPPKQKIVQPPAPVPKPQATPKPVTNSATPNTPTATTAPELPPATSRAAEAAPVAPAPTPIPTPAPLSPPTPAKPVTANIEAEYVGKLRAHLNSIKRYPTGREASQLRPQGKVRLWFVLRRDGSVVDVGVDASSNSMLLDDAARKTITRASFSAFPDNTWTGESTHRFTAELEFIPGG